MHKKRWTIVGIIVVIILLAVGGTYWNMSHSVAKKVPGNTYRYQSVSKDKALYITFAQSGDQVVVNQNKSTALKAATNSSDFNSEYQTQSKDATWTYKADGGTLTLAETSKDNKVSQWQYNKILATSKKFTSHSFTYQIADAGQGQVKSKTVFEKVN